MKKILYLLLLLVTIIIVVRVCRGSNNNQVTSEQGATNDQIEEISLEQKVAYFEKKHKRLDTAPARTYCREGRKVEYSLYPDKYYEEVKELYKAEIAFNLDQFGEEATQKVIFLLRQIAVVGRYDCETVSGNKLRYKKSHNSYPQLFEAERVQIAHAAINNICDYAITLAYGYGYEQMAQSILVCYKPDIHITPIEERRHHYTVSTSYTSRDNSKAQIALLFSKK